MVGIPYKSDAVEIADLISGQVDLTFGSAALVAPHVKSGRLKALAITSLQPSPLFPGLPTVAASGLPGYEAGTIQGLFAPTGTPLTIINLLNQETVRSLKTPEAKEKFFNIGVDIVGGSPQEAAMLVKSEIAKWGKVIKDAGIKAN
jgi:tripartite-type tricarboxylate transporter receptor subunit TctC